MIQREEEKGRMRVEKERGKRGERKIRKLREWRKGEE